MRDLSLALSLELFSYVRLNRSSRTIVIFLWTLALASGACYTMTLVDSFTTRRWVKLFLRRNHVRTFWSLWRMWTFARAVVQYFYIFWFPCLLILKTKQVHWTWVYKLTFGSNSFATKKIVFSWWYQLQLFEVVLKPSYMYFGNNHKVVPSSLWLNFSLIPWRTHFFNEPIYVIRITGLIHLG